MREALIILLPKAGKPNNNKCENMRPMSRINTDTKILSKILAKRLEGVFSDIVEDIQNGFIKGRPQFHNVRRVVSILHNKKDMALLLLRM